MQVMERMKEHVATFQKMSYVSEEEIEMTSKVIDCGYGINPFGYSPLIAKKKAALPIEINHYPRYPYREFRRSIARYWEKEAGIGEKNIKIGNGSLGILTTINRLLVEKNFRVLGYCPQFTEYISDVGSWGGVYEYITLSEKNNYRFSCEELLAKLNREHGIIYLDNPNNPSGQVIPLPELEEIVKTADENNQYVIVDEAYGDFISKKESAIGLVPQYDNLLVVRSFSKGFGLAGLRLGYLVAPEEFIRFYEKVELPFTSTDIGCRIAMLALEDEAFLQQSVEKICLAKTELIGKMKNFKIWDTDPRVPIMVLEHPNWEEDLYRLLAGYFVITESGKDFVAMGKNRVRLRIPKCSGRLLEILKKIDRSL